MDIRNCTLFAGLDDDGFARAMEFFKAGEKSYRKGEYLLHQGESVRRFGFVASGRVQVASYDISGERVIMASVGEGQTFGESMCFLGERHAKVYIMASEDSRIIWLHCDFLSDAGKCDGFSQMMRCRFCAMLAQRTLDMNSRIQTLSKKTLRRKLYTYFAQMENSAGAGEFDISMSRDEMADYLGADRSALSRELGNMRRDGEIDFSGKHFKVHRRGG